MTLDAKALDAAGVRTPEYWADHIAQLTTPETRRKEIIHAIKSSIRDTIDAADLVPRSELDKLEAETVDLRLHSSRLQERMETLRDAATDSVCTMMRRREKAEAERDEALSLAETQGQQLAALREVLEALRDLLSFGPLTVEARTSFIARANAGLTDTDAAAAQWVRVDEWRDFAQLAAHACRESLRYGRPGKHDEYCWCNGGRPTHSPGCVAMRALHDQTRQLLAAAPNLSSVAEGEAGEKEGE
ncbi:MAG: hypothetical protein V3S55_06180 [Nitrospiraceae bacterium]